MSVNDDDTLPWLTDEKRSSQRPSERGRPSGASASVSNCLRRALVRACTPETTPEVGLLPVDLTTKGPRTTRLRRASRRPGHAPVAWRYVRPACRRRAPASSAATRTRRSGSRTRTASSSIWRSRPRWRTSGPPCPPTPHRSSALWVPALRTILSAAIEQRSARDARARPAASSSAGSITSSCRRAARCRRDGPGNGCRPADYRIEPTPHGCSLRAWCGDHVGVRRLRRRERGPAYRAGPRRARFPRRRHGHPRLPRGHVAGPWPTSPPSTCCSSRSSERSDGARTSASTARSRSGRSRFSARSCPATRQSPSCWQSSSSARGCRQPRRQP